MHGGFCALNDIVDIKVDGQVERTKARPLPSARITVAGASFLSCVLCFGGLIFTYNFLGPAAFQAGLPSCLLAIVYPYMKRVVSWPQLFLAPAVAGSAFVGWVSVVGNFRKITECMPLFILYCCWTIYFDTCYALQDAENDKEIGAGSLAVALGYYLKIFLGVLGVFILALLSLTAIYSRATMVFWTFGIGVWAATLPFQLNHLDVKRPKTGGTVFRFNIALGMYVSLVCCAELLSSKNALGN